MDILNIDEVLEADSSCLFDEDNQEDVKNILQQWKQKMRDTISKPDTRTFTRVKQKINNSDIYYNKFDQENKEIDFDIRNNRSFDYNCTFNNQKQNEPYETLLYDISPPVSSGFVTDGNQLNKSLIITNYHGGGSGGGGGGINKNDLNDHSINNDDNDDAIIVATDNTTERTFHNNSIINHLNNDDKNDDDNDDIKPILNNSNNEIFDLLTISGIKDFNIAQIDELSQLDFSYPNSYNTTESNDNLLSSSIQNSKENISDIEDDYLLGKTLELKSNYYHHDKKLLISNSSSNSNLSSSTIINNSAFSDKTFTKRSKQYNTTTKILNDKNDDDFNDVTKHDDFININDISSNEFNSNNSDNKKLWKINNDNENINSGITGMIHSTPFRNPLIKSNEMNNRIIKDKQQNKINTNLNTNKNDYNNIYDDDLDIENYVDNDDDIEIQNTDNNKHNKLKLNMNLDNEDETEEYLKNEEIANYQQNHIDDVDVDDVDVDVDDDYKDEININAVKMKQSLDNIKKRHFSQKHDKKMNKTNNSDTLNSTKILGTITNTNRLLSRRSRLYENLDTIQIDINNLGSSSNNSSISSSSSNNNCNKKVKENKNVSTAATITDEYNNKSDGENDKTFVQLDKMKKDNESKNVIGQLKIPQMNKKLEMNVMNETFSKHSNDFENPKEATAATSTATIVKNKYRDNRVLQKPRYISQYFRQTAENFQKANSAGDLNRTINLDDKHNGKIDDTCNPVQSNSINTKPSIIGNKAKSLHNLASNITLADDKYSEMKIKKPEFNFKQPAAPLHYDVNKMRKNSSDGTCDSTSAAAAATARPSVVPYRTRLIRPSSGYYSSTDIKTPLTGLMQNLSVNDSSDIGKNTGIIDKKNINSINNSELNNHHNNKIETITTTTAIPSNNPQSTFIKPATRTVRRSGLPRPSINIKR